MSFFGGGKKKEKQQQLQRETQQAQVDDAPAYGADGAVAGGAGAGGAAAAPRASKLRDEHTTDTGAAEKTSKKPVARPMSSSSSAAAVPTSKVAAPAPARLGTKTMMAKKSKAAVSRSDRSASFSSSASSASSASSSPTTTTTTTSSLVAASDAKNKDQEKETAGKEEQAASKDTRKNSEEAAMRTPASPAAAPAPAPAAAAPMPDVSRAPSLIQSRRSMASLGSEDDEGFFDDDALPMMLQSDAVLTPEPAPAVEADALDDEEDEDEAQAAPSGSVQVEMAPGGAFVREEIDDNAPQAQQMAQQESPFAFAPTLREQMSEAKQQAQAQASSSSSVASVPRTIQFSEMHSVNQINAEVLEASIPSASGSAELVPVVGRVVDAELFESLRALLSAASASGAQLMPIEALVEPAPTTPGQAGVVLVRRSGVLEDSVGLPLTMHASLQSAQGLGSCFQPGSTSLRPLLVALAEYVRGVQWLLQHDAPTMVGGLRQIPFLPSASASASSSSSSSSDSRVHLPASSLLLLHRSLYPHLFDSAASAAFLEARSQELQSARYLSPESVRDGVVGTEATEVWAIGCTVWEALHQGRFRAYEDAQPHASVNQLLLGVATGSLALSRPPKLEGEAGQPRQQQQEELVRIMEACTQREPAARPSLESVLQRLQAMI